MWKILNIYLDLALVLVPLVYGSQVGLSNDLFFFFWNH